MIQVIERAIDILEFVATHESKPVQLIKIAENARLSQPTCANIIKTLVSRNYLENVSRKEGYILGISAYKLTGTVEYNQGLIAASSDLMKELVQAVNETCLLGIIKNNKRVVINEVQANNDLQVKTKKETDIYGTASGKLLMSFLPEKDLNLLIDNIGLPDASNWPGVKSKSSLLKALDLIAKAQMVQTITSNHITGLAVPVFKKKQVVAALSVYLPESRLTVAHKKNILKQLNSTADQISVRLNKEG